jgi:hypothetical protein
MKNGSPRAGQGIPEAKRLACGAGGPTSGPSSRRSSQTTPKVNPTRVKPDLTKLTDEELDQLEKIVLKVGTGASGAGPSC